MSIENNIWVQVKNILKETTESSIFEQTYEPIKEIFREETNFLLLVVPDAYHKYRVDKFYLDSMNKILASLNLTEKKFKIITQEEADSIITKENNVQPLTETPSVIITRNLRSDYTFENFVTGEANREAFTFAIKVAESPNVTINPFYIFGDVGLGKTHLMMSIGHYILENNPKANVIYTISLQFLEDFVKAKSKNQKDPNAAFEFDNYYRSADLLLVDDIQYLENRQGLQDEFFKLFEYLFENNKQIVVTSDKKASELNIMARLKSRFSWGIQTDIRRPNLELRINILKKKLSYLITDPSQVDQEALYYIASHFVENLRDLEGALRRFVSYCVSFNFPFNLEYAKISLQTLINDDEEVESDLDQRDIEKIKTCVATYFNLSPKDLASKSRKKECVYARDLCIYILKSSYDVTLSSIGYYFGGRDHSTIAHSFDKINELVKLDEGVRSDIEYINKMLSKKAD